VCSGFTCASRYEPEQVLDADRQRLLRNLQEAFPDHTVLPWLSAGLVVNVRRATRLAFKRDVLRRTMLDFVVLQQDGTACFAFKVGAKRLSRSGDRLEDTYVAHALARAGVTLYRISSIKANLKAERLRDIVGQRHHSVWGSTTGSFVSVEPPAPDSQISPPAQPPVLCIAQALDKASADHRRAA
jgi:hypothetical protein